jgi:hypothetical protein
MDSPNFGLVVNLKIAKAIGVTIPETFLARADRSGARGLAGYSAGTAGRSHT